MISVVLSLLIAQPTPGPVPQRRVEGTTAIRVYMDGGSFGINCLPASALDGGCLTTGAQTIAGSKTWSGEAFFQDNIRVSGAYVGSTLQSRIAGEGMGFYGQRAIADPTFDYTFNTTQLRTGPHTAWQRQSSTVGYVDAYGGIHAGMNVLSEAAFLDESGQSGHTTLSCKAGIGGNYITIKSCNSSNGNSGYHGSVTIGSSGAKDAGGLTFQVQGAFPGPNSNAATTAVITDLGEFVSNDSWFQNAVETGSHSDVACGVPLFGETAGTGRGRFGYYSPSDQLRVCTSASATAGAYEAVCTDRNGLCGSATHGYFPSVLVNTTLTASTLGGYVAPPDKAPRFSAAHFYVGASGTGGSTNAIIRASDGVLNCDFAFACNAATGPKRITGTDSGCTLMSSGATVTYSVTSIGNCTTGPTITGNLTPEGYWR